MADIQRTGDHHQSICPTCNLPAVREQSFIREAIRTSYFLCPLGHLWAVRWVAAA